MMALGIANGLDSTDPTDALGDPDNDAYTNAKDDRSTGFPVAIEDCSGSQ